MLCSPTGCSYVQTTHHFLLFLCRLNRHGGISHGSSSPGLRQLHETTPLKCILQQHKLMRVCPVLYPAIPSHKAPKTHCHQMRKDKLLGPEMVLRMYPKLRGESNVGSLATKLAREGRKSRPVVLSAYGRSARTAMQGVRRAEVDNVIAILPVLVEATEV